VVFVDEGSEDDGGGDDEGSEDDGGCDDEGSEDDSGGGDDGGGGDDSPPEGGVWVPDDPFGSVGVPASPDLPGSVDFLGPEGPPVPVWRPVLVGFPVSVPPVGGFVPPPDCCPPWPSPPEPDPLPDPCELPSLSFPCALPP
jgi:hypothetical protein